jgi:hypothetical protein
MVDGAIYGLADVEGQIQWGSAIYYADDDSFIVVSSDYGHLGERIRRRDVCYSVEPLEAWEW